MIILSGISMDPYFSEVSLHIVRVASCQEVTSGAEVLYVTYQPPNIAYCC